MNENFSFTLSDACNLTEVHIVEKGNDSQCISYTASTGAKPNNIFALARAFLSIDTMTHKKLQKLCYYAKAWYLAIYDKNLVPEHFEAWVHGAVQPSLYQRYKCFGFSDIPRNADVSNIPDEYISFAKEVYASYGHLSGDQLEVLNHQEFPWTHARGDCKQWEPCNNTISEQDMKEYYRKQMI